MALGNLGTVPSGQVEGIDSSNGRPTVTVVILAKNEASRIAQCLKSVRWADEVIVMDDESQDETPVICQRVGARVIRRPLHEDFAAQRNCGSALAQGEWILQLDADEVISPSLRDEIRQAIHQQGIVAYRLTRLNWFLGRPMRYGGWGWQGLKLFKKSAGSYQGQLHESLVVHGPTAPLHHPIHHYPFTSLSQFIERSNIYSDIGAKLLRQQMPVVTSRYLRYHLFLRPLKRFWKSYVKQSGWRDGMHGLVFAALSAWTHFLLWAKYWSLGLPPASTTSSDAQGAWTSRSSRARCSVVVLTKNEERHILRCLKSVRWADELIVVDGLSTDRTPAICQAFGARVISHAFDGSFATDRNLGLDAANGEWILQLDADDVVTPEFQTAFEGLTHTHSPHAAFKFYRRSVLLGRRMRYGGWHYAVPNLLRRTAARYEGLVHERPMIHGTVGVLNADIEHHPCEDLSTFVARHNRYTSLQAEELFRSHGKMSERQLRRLIWKKPWKTFWKSYVKKAGFREGWHGLVFAEFFAGVELLKWAKYWERCGSREQRGIVRCESL